VAQEQARRAGQAFAAYRRRRRAVDSPYEDEWPELRRAILAQGGIGPSKDWDNDSWPGDLYRAGGKAPDLVADETTIGYADRPPWGEGGDNVMHNYLERAHTRHEQITGKDRRGPAEEEPEETGPRRSHAGRRNLTERESRAHEERMSAWVRQVRAARAAEPRAPAVGFYTDRHDVVHPVTAAREAGRRYALRRGK
jgi:hypothetical protein